MTSYLYYNTTTPAFQLSNVNHKTTIVILHLIFEMQKMLYCFNLFLYYIDFTLLFAVIRFFLTEFVFHSGTSNDVCD